MTTTYADHHQPATATLPAGPRQIGPFLARAMIKAVDTLYLWQRRIAEREHLLALDDRMLSDVGITRADAAREAGKRFWQA